MSKFFKLCSCESIKIWKKKSTKVMLIILILSIFASAGIAALTKKLYALNDEFFASNDYKTMTKSDMETLKVDLETNKNSLDEASKNEMQAQIDIYQIALDYDINTYNTGLINTEWKATTLTTDIYYSKVNYYNYKSMGDEESALKEQANIDKELDLIKNNDYTAYMKLQKDLLKQNYDNKLISEEEYEISLHTLELKEKYEVGKEYNSEETWKETLISEIENLRYSINYGIDTNTRKALTEKDLKKAEDTIKINEYRLEHDMPPYTTGVSLGKTRKVFDYMVGGLTMMVLAVIIIIIAGSMVSSEVSKGTIKFWSFTPNKRWKILLSKLITAVLTLVILTVFITLVSSLIGNIFFGSKDAQGYLYVSGGEVHSINYIAYMLLYNLVGALEIFMFLLLAIMLSTVARNTAVAVGISIAAYLGGSTITQILNMFVKSEWIKFIPFNNLSLTDRIFTNDVSYTASSMVTSLTGNISVKFSLILLGICAVIMIVTMFDSFRKRDII